MKILRRAFAATIAISCTGAAIAQDIKLGISTDLSASASAEYSVNAITCIQLAMDDINAKGGVLGRKLALVVRDDLAQPPKAIQNVAELIDNEKIAGLFGPTNSGNALAYKHIVTQKRTPVLTSLGTSTDIVKPMTPGADNYNFRVSATDREQMRSLFTYAKKNAKTKNVAFLVDSTGYGQAGLRDLNELAALYGIKPVAIEKLGPNDTDMTSQLNKFKEAGVDTLFVWALGTPIGHVMRSMEKIDYFPTTLTSWAADSKGFSEIAGPKLSGIPVFMRAVAPEMSPRTQELAKRVEIKLAGQSFLACAQGYDATQLFAAAIAQAGKTDGPAVRAALEDLQKPMAGYIKTYQKPFSKTQREALSGADFLWSRWKDGKVVIYTDELIKGLKPGDFVPG
ncbi:MAG: branched-chain amino acid transporter substrate-binding protein [Marmoricola sp.]|nr:branched-chain amino acid transporter substrate-binding protein [Marmoricola sp.]